MRPLPRLNHHNRSLRDFLDGNLNAFTREELLEVWTRHGLDRDLERGYVTRILPGIYCSTRHRTVPRVMGEAINLWHPAGLVTGFLALHLYGNSLPFSGPALVRVAAGRSPRPQPGVKSVQGQRVWGMSMPGGVRCVPPGLALLDAWRHAPPHARKDLLYEALWAKSCSWREVAREAKKAPRIAGRRELKRILGWFAEGAISPLEVRAKHETFADARFRDLEWQVELRLNRRNVVADILHRASKVVVELDSEKFHSSKEARLRDRERDIDLAAAGYLTMQLGWDDVVNRPEWCRRNLLAIIATRLPSARGT